MTESTPSSRKGAPKGDKRARTRAALIAAAAEVIGERGYERTSLEAVAARAGMSRGAIYGNFRDKEELLLAFAETRWRPLRPTLRRGANLRAQLGIIGAAVAEVADQRRTEAAGVFSFLTYVATHEALRQSLVAANAEVYAAMASALAELVAPEQPRIPADQLVRILHGMSDGFVIARILQPEVFTTELIVAAFEALA